MSDALPFPVTPGALAARSQAREDEDVLAYYVLLSLHPEYVDASPVVRSQAIDRIVAGLRAALRGFAASSPLDMRAHGQALAFMEADRDARHARQRIGGW